MSAKRLRYGMVGGGPGAFIGGVHRAALRLNNEADLVCGSFSSKKDKQDLICEELHIAPDRRYENYLEMAEREGARTDKIDFVSIVTPNCFHYEAAEAFLKQGIYVVCEKPLCLTLQEALNLKKSAAENDCLFAVCYAYTGHLMAREARALIGRGEIGDIRLVVAEYPQDWLIEHLERSSNEQKPWRENPSFAGRGGAIADLGTHVENWVNYVSGLELQSLCCRLDRFGTADDGLDNNAACLLRFKNGASGLYWISQVAFGFDNALKIRIIGDRGSLEFAQEENNHLKLSLRGQAPQLYKRGNAYISEEAAKYNRLPSGHPEGLVEAFANLYQDFCRAIRAKEKGCFTKESDYGYPTIDMGIAGVRFVSKCLESDEAGGIWLEVES